MYRARRRCDVLEDATDTFEGFRECVVEVTGDISTSVLVSRDINGVYAMGDLFREKHLPKADFNLLPSSMPQSLSSLRLSSVYMQLVMRLYRCHA